MKSKMQLEQIVPTRNYADCKRTQCFNSLPIYSFWKPQTNQFGNCVWIIISWIWLKRDPTSDTPNMIVIINLKDIFCNCRDVFTSKTSYWMLPHDRDKNIWKFLHLKSYAAKLVSLIQVITDPIIWKTYEKNLLDFSSSRTPHLLMQ